MKPRVIVELKLIQLYTGFFCMAIKTTLEHLEEVQAAITKIMTAQDVSMGDKRVMYARLDFLQKREDALLARYKTEQAGSGAGGFINKVRFDDQT